MNEHLVKQYDIRVEQGSHSFCPDKLPNFSKPTEKPASHVETDLTGQNQTKNSHSQPARSYMCRMKRAV